MLVALTCTVLSGCTADDARSSIDSESRQAIALRDGVVTREEYDASFRDFLACAEEHGITIVGGDMIGDQRSYSYVSSGSESHDACYDEFYMHVDIEWQIAHFMSSTTARIIQSCLIEHGVQPGKTEEELLTQLDQNDIELQSCTDR